MGLISCVEWSILGVLRYLTTKCCRFSQLGALWQSRAYLLTYLLNAYQTGAHPEAIRHGRPRKVPGIFKAQMVSVCTIYIHIKKLSVEISHGSRPIGGTPVCPLPQQHSLGPPLFKLLESLDERRNIVLTAFRDDVLVELTALNSRSIINSFVVRMDDLFSTTTSRSCDTHIYPLHVDRNNPGA